MHGDNDMLTGLYAGVIDCMPIGVVALGSELAIVMMNRAARQIVGQDADWTDHPAQQWLDALFGAERAQPLILKLREVMATGRAFSQELPAGTGTLELTASLLSGEEAAATGVLLLQDITERRRLEQGLREQEQ